ncbi:complement component C8 gamma chain [Mugil cephalus]|uniref:complement component C8 gamma chain n=1 Tax=Mugil cephalus TaxID=48193 RepID=UPI001FB602C1|nr:complement component C8 gamma chain [Mugil cephalus]
MAGVWRYTLAVAVLMCLWDFTEAVGGAVSRPRPVRRPPKKPKVDPIDLTQPAQNIDIERMTGTWYLLLAASKCSFLMTQGTKVEPTVMVLTRTPDSAQTLSVSTKTRHSHQCWEIRQVYTLTTTPGRLTLKGARPEMNTEIVVGETDYTSYAIIYYQKRGKMTMKLYSRSLDNLSEPMLAKFEQLSEKQGMGLAYLFPFPTYSHCGTVDEDHIINCVPTC